MKVWVLRPDIAATRLGELPNGMGGDLFYADDITAIAEYICFLP